MIDEHGKTEIDYLTLAVQCAARRVIFSFIVCTIVIISVFVHYGNNLQDVGDAQELATTRLRVEAAIKARCSDILPLIESARIRNQAQEEPDPIITKELDRIEETVRAIRSPTFGILVEAYESSTIIKGSHD